jgi:ABC-type Fe3+ transport system permease subunit
MHHDTFNADFYVTAATIIPIFLLALTLQGRTIEDLLSRIYKEYQREYSRDILLSAVQRLRVAIIAFLILVVIILIIYSGFLGEWYSVTSLYNRASSVNHYRAVLGSIFILLIIVVAGPMVKIGGAYWRGFRLLYGRRGTQADSDAPKDSPE